MLFETGTHHLDCVSCFHRPPVHVSEVVKDGIDRNSKERCQSNRRVDFPCQGPSDPDNGGKASARRKGQG